MELQELLSLRTPSSVIHDIEPREDDKRKPLLDWNKPKSPAKLHSFGCPESIGLEHEDVVKEIQNSESSSVAVTARASTGRRRRRAARRHKVPATGSIEVGNVMQPLTGGSEGMARGDSSAVAGKIERQTPAEAPGNTPKMMSATESQLSSGSSWSMKRARGIARPRGKIRLRDLKDSAVRLPQPMRIPAIEDIKIDFGSTPFQSARKFMRPDVDKEEGESHAIVVTEEDGKEISLDPRELNKEIILKGFVRQRKDHLLAEPGKESRSRSRLKNFKRFRGNKMAELAKKRAIARHVDFDVVVHDSFLTKEWVVDASRDRKMMKNIDSLLESNKRPEARKARSAAAKSNRSARGRGAGAPKRGRKRRARMHG